MIAKRTYFKIQKDFKISEQLRGDFQIRREFEKTRTK